MKAPPLERARIIGVNQTCPNDLDFFERCVSALKRARFKGDPTLTQIVRHLPSFEAANYSVGHARVKLNGSSRRPFHAIDVIHEGVHQIVANSFAVERRGAPEMTLLNECIGIATEWYLALRGFDRRKKPNQFALQRLRYWRLNAIRLGHSARYAGEIYRSERLKPFRSYQMAVVEMFRIEKLLLRHFQALKANEFSDLGRLSRQLKRSRYFPMIHRQSNIKPALFCSVNCGFNSSQKDQLAVQKCLRMLDDSQCMVEFFDRVASAK